MVAPGISPSRRRCSAGRMSISRAPSAHAWRASRGARRRRRARRLVQNRPQIVLVFHRKIPSPWQIQCDAVVAEDVLDADGLRRPSRRQIVEAHRGERWRVDVDAGRGRGHGIRHVVDARRSERARDAGRAERAAQRLAFATLGVQLDQLALGDREGAGRPAVVVQLDVLTRTSAEQPDLDLAEVGGTGSASAGRDRGERAAARGRRAAQSPGRVRQGASAYRTPAARAAAANHRSEIAP